MTTTISPPYTEHILANGLRVILHVDNAAPVVAVNVLYHVGSKDEQIGKTGLAHLLEHMSYDSGPNLAHGDYDRLCTTVGGENNAFTTSDITSYYITLPSNNLALGMWLEAQRMSGFALAQEVLDTQLRVIIEEKHQTIDDVPYADAVPLMKQQSYDEHHSYRWDTIGSMDDLVGMTMNDVHDFYQRTYTPSNATLAIAGDFARADGLELAEKYFGKIVNAQGAMNGAALTDGRRFGESIVRESSEVPFAAVFLAWHAPSLHDVELRALELLATALADGESSRLYRSLEYELEIASETDCFIDDGELGSLFYVYAVGQNPDVTADELKDAIRREVDRVVSNGITEHELQKAKNTRTTEMVRSISSVGMRAERMAFFATMYNDAGRAFSESEIYKSISISDVQQAAAKLFATAPNEVEYHPMDG